MGYLKLVGEEAPEPAQRIPLTTIFGVQLPPLPPYPESPKKKAWSGSPASDPACHKSTLGPEVPLKQTFPRGYPRSLTPRQLAVRVSVDVACEAIKRNAQAGMTSVQVAVDSVIVGEVVESILSKQPTLHEIVVGGEEGDGLRKTMFIFW